MHPLTPAALVAAFFVAGCQAAPEPRPAVPLRSHVAPAEAGPRLRCARRDEVLAWLAGFGERLQSAGIGASGVLAEAYANPVTGTWIWLLTRPDGLSCLWSLGEGWRRSRDGTGGPGALRRRKSTASPRKALTRASARPPCTSASTSRMRAV